MLKDGTKVKFIFKYGRDTRGYDPKDESTGIIVEGVIDHHIVDSVYSIAYNVKIEEKIGDLVIESMDHIHYGLYHEDELHLI